MHEVVDSRLSSILPKITAHAPGHSCPQMSCPVSSTLMSAGCALCLALCLLDEKGIKLACWTCSTCSEAVVSDFFTLQSGIAYSLNVQHGPFALQLIVLQYSIKFIYKSALWMRKVEQMTYRYMCSARHVFFPVSACNRLAFLTASCPMAANQDCLDLVTAGTFEEPGSCSPSH